MATFDPNYESKPDITSLTEISEILEPNKVVDGNFLRIVNDVVNAPSKTELQKQFELFNINQSKKNALRIAKLMKTLDKVDDEVINRFEKRADQMTNKELLDYMNAISAQIDHSQKMVDIIAPPADSIISRDGAADINVENKGDNYTINLGTELTRDNKENVVNAVKQMLGIWQNTTPQDIINNQNVEEPTVEVVEEKDLE